MAQPDVRRLLRFARDLQRANDNGWTTYARIRERHPEIPCLFATGYAPELMPDLRNSDLPVEVLAKLFEPDALLRAVRRARGR